MENNLIALGLTADERCIQSHYALSVRLIIIDRRCILVYELLSMRLSQVTVDGRCTQLWALSKRLNLPIVGERCTWPWVLSMKAWFVNYRQEICLTVPSIEYGLSRFRHYNFLPFSWLSHLEKKILFIQHLGSQIKIHC